MPTCLLIYISIYFVDKALLVWQKHSIKINIYNLYVMAAKGIELVSPRNNRLSDEILISLRKIFRVVAINSKKLNKQVGLTTPQLLILKEIERDDELTPGEIARAVSLSHATVTGILGRLEKRNLLIRQ
jgi:DNA-binding transcriptional ArsR family regulator